MAIASIHVVFPIQVFTHRFDPKREISVQKGLCIIALSIAVVILVLFAADLILGLSGQTSLAPFKYASMVTDIVFIVVSGILAAMSWFTLREQV